MYQQNDDNGANNVYQSEKEQKWDKMYSRLMEMGFEHNAAKKAAILFPDDLNSAITKAQNIVTEIESVNNFLKKGLQEQNMNLLSIGVNKAQDMSYTDNDLYRKAYKFYNGYFTFYSGIQAKYSYCT